MTEACEADEGAMETQQHMDNRANATTETASSASELLMLRLRYRESKLVHAAGNTPLLLTDKQMAWIVYTGRLDIFMAPFDASLGCVSGAQRHLFRVQAAQAVFGTGLPGGAHSIALLAVGDPGTQLLQVKRTTLQTLAQDAAFTEPITTLLDGWITGFSESIAAGQDMPREVTLIEPKGTFHLAPGQTAHPGHSIVWVKPATGAATFMNTQAPLPAESYFPFSGRTWLQSSDASQFHAASTPVYLSQDQTWLGLNHFHQLALQCIQRSAKQAEQEEHLRWQNRVASDRRQVTSAMARLAATLKPRTATYLSEELKDTDPLWAACQWLGQAMGITLQPPYKRSGQPLKDPIGEIARASHIRIRQVMLRDDWWRHDDGPLLAYLTKPLNAQTEAPAQPSEGRPVALVPGAGQRRRGSAAYNMLDPIAQTSTPVTASVAALISPLAHVFYRPLPNRSPSGPDLFKQSLRGSRQDVASLVLAGLAMGILGLIVPLLTGILFDQVIPSVQRSQMLQLCLGLLVGAVAVAMFQLVRNIAVLRLESNLTSWMQAAICDRLLRLPAAFFRQYAAGDLAERVLAMGSLGQIISEAAISSVLSGVFSIFSLGLLVYYAPGLAWGALGVMLLFGSITACAGYRQAQLAKRLHRIQSHLTGLVLQFVTGIAKFRASGAESRAYARWAREFSQQRQVAFQSRLIGGYLQALQAAYPVLALLVVFGLVSLAGDAGGTLSTGTFLAFNAALSQLLAASLALASAANSILRAIPVYEGIKPILQTPPETYLAKADPGILSGEIEISHVSFRYQKDAPSVLDDISLHIRPGEFVAIVGPSGCGKSTLLRLLLKFESPQAGAIYLDGQDLGRLDVEAVRRQMGVVLQDGKLSAGSILSNIIGSSTLTQEDALEATQLVGLKQDIEQMPMGLHTVLSAGGGNLSGGQRQRLLIARAIVSRPRILLFDEATSALDNPNQSLVSASLEQLNATRVVIAHRLSTIVNADCIYVFEGGKIVQSGTYSELINQRGPFAELAKRQQA
jgi:NHLM bacteriocin system ABC transporter ATP-binding protein